MEGNRSRIHDVLSVVLVLFVFGLLTVPLVPKPSLRELYDRSRFLLTSSWPLMYLRSSSHQTQHMNTQRYVRILETLQRIQQKIQNQHVDLIEIEDKLNRIGSQQPEKRRDTAAAVSDQDVVIHTSRAALRQALLAHKIAAFYITPTPVIQTTIGYRTKNGTVGNFV